eukprot:TRINITY_DN17968_c1_g1_i8.p1 TRINITY_DN17968_c1_g1~~TRINITY_DN17968_c1_g1_i8.p1  ORF type:complete len:1336 (+),score=75.46 TRINITY_DN17968_c1_g1_i8:84-4091(+)
MTRLRHRRIVAAAAALCCMPHKASAQCPELRTCMDCTCFHDTICQDCSATWPGWTLVAPIPDDPVSCCETVSCTRECPTASPSLHPSSSPTWSPTTAPTAAPTKGPSETPSGPTSGPSAHPSAAPSGGPSTAPSGQPGVPSAVPTRSPLQFPSEEPFRLPSLQPSTTRPGAPAVSSPSPTLRPAQPSGMPFQRPSAPTIPPAPSPSSAPPADAPSAHPSTASPNQTAQPPRAAQRYACRHRSAAELQLTCLLALPGDFTHSYDWANCSGACPPPGEEAPERPTEAPTQLPTTEPAMGPEVACERLHCQRGTACRLASTCRLDVSGSPFCVAGSPKADQTPCDDGSKGAVNDTCSSGKCVGVLVGCQLTAECSARHDPQCGRLGCGADGYCHHMITNEGLECDDGDPNTARDTCSEGMCRGTDFCQEVQCGAPSQCRERAECDRSVGRCAASQQRADGDPCVALQLAAARDVCFSGECGTYAVMRIAELTFKSGALEASPVAVVSPGSDLSSAAAFACTAADGRRDTDWVDWWLGRVAVSSGAVGSGELDLTTQVVNSDGELVIFFATRVQLSVIEAVDSRSYTSQAMTLVAVQGCTGGAGLARAHRLAIEGGCSAGATRAALEGIAVALRTVHWTELPSVSEHQPVPPGTSRAFAVSSSQPHVCYRLRPLRLCGGLCLSDDALLTEVQGIGIGLAGLALIALGAFSVGICVGWRKEPAAPEPPPLTGADEQQVQQRCRDAVLPLASCWRETQRSLLDEMIARAEAPVAGREYALQCFRELLRQPWRADLDERTASLPLAVLVALRFYSQEPQDIDRELGHRDAPAPTKDSAGHGLPCKPAKPGWPQYKKKYKATGEARSKNHYRLPNKASFELCATLRATSLDQYKDWVMYVGALTWAAAVSRWAGVSPEEELVLTRLLGNLPRKVRKGYERLRPGSCFALPCLSSTTTLPKAKGEFLGDHPALAVLLRLRFDPSRALGVDMRQLSMYPQESEVLLPMFTMFRVTAVRRVRRLDKELELPEPKGARAKLQRLYLHACAAARPLLVVEGDCIGTVMEKDPEASQWMAEVEADAKESSVPLVEVDCKHSITSKAAGAVGSTGASALSCAGSAAGGHTPLASHVSVEQLSVQPQQQQPQQVESKVPLVGFAPVHEALQASKPPQAQQEKGVPRVPAVAALSTQDRSSAPGLSGCRPQHAPNVIAASLEAEAPRLVAAAAQNAVQNTTAAIQAPAELPALQQPLLPPPQHSQGGPALSLALPPPVPGHVVRRNAPLPDYALRRNAPLRVGGPGGAPRRALPTDTLGDAATRRPRSSTLIIPPSGSRRVDSAGGSVSTVL